MRMSHRFARVIMNGTDKNKLLSQSVASGWTLHYRLRISYTSTKVLVYGIPGGGGGVLKKVLYGEAPARGPTPYPFIYHFFRKGTPFVYLLLEKGTPFIHLLKKTVFLFLNAWNELYQQHNGKICVTL